MDSKENFQKGDDERTRQKKSNSENSSIFIGKKPLNNYLNSIRLQLKKENNRNIILKARGKFISKAVDVAELAKRGKTNLKTKTIQINTEEYQKENKNKIKVSTIEILLTTD